MKLNRKNKEKAFTLIELLIVIATIGLLATIILISADNARIKSREAFRRASLRQIAVALELYYSDNQSYPNTNGVGWGEDINNGSHGYSGANGYIPNLAPQYIAKLPSDPLKNIGQDAGCVNVSGFIYISNGIDYKLMDHCVVEIAPQTTDQFYDPVRPTWALQVSTAGGRNW